MELTQCSSRAAATSPDILESLRVIIGIVHFGRVTGSGNVAHALVSGTSWDQHGILSKLHDYNWTRHHS
jgi:hypothetical protein